MRKFEVKVIYFNQEVEKKVTEVLLIEAENIGQAELIALNNMPEFTDVVQVTLSKIENINEYSKEVDEPFFMCTNEDIIIDEVSGKETKRTIKYLIKAESNASANSKFQDILDGYGAEIDIKNVTQSKIVQFIERDAPVEA